MFLISTIYKTVFLFLVILLITMEVQDTNINIPESPDFLKGSFVENVKHIPQKLLNTFKTWFGATKANIRPWGSEFFNTDNLKTPPSFQRLLKRALNNISYFQGNYAIIALILMAYSLLTSPLLLLIIVLTYFLANMLAARNAKSKLFVEGYEISLQNQYAILGVCSLPIYYWAGVGQLVFWVLGASFFLTSVHAAFYNIDALIQPEDQLNLVMNQVI